MYGYSRKLMELNIRNQSLLLDGKNITAGDVVKVCKEGLADMPEHLADLYSFLYEWFDESDSIVVQTSGSTGVPKKIKVEKKRMVASAVMTCSFLGLKKGDRALLCMNLKYIGAKMMVVRSLVYGMNLVVRPATGHPFAGISGPLNFVAVVPMQMYNTMYVPEEADVAARTDCIIIGGGAVSRELVYLVNKLPSAVYSTYGMTETLSHIALRRLNGENATDSYVPLPGVNVFLSEDNTLNIDAPALCESVLKTNDIAEFCSDGSFRILGRIDNVINSGGLKIYPEQIEEKLSVVLGRRFVITSLYDNKYGEAVALMLEGNENLSYETFEEMKRIIPKYCFPKHIIYVERIPITDNGKIARAECRLIINKGRF